MSTVLPAREPSARYLVQQQPLVQCFELMVTAPGGVARLRELILTLAVQGKLVPQDPNDEPASELLKTIRTEKDRLIAEGNIKRHSPLVGIAGDAKPFRLPDGWEWVRNEMLLSLRKGKNPKTLSEQPVGKPYLDIEALDRHQIRRYSSESPAVLCTAKDILVVCDGSRSGLVLQGKDGIVGSTLAVIETPELIQPYIKLIFRTGYQRYNSGMKGAAIPHLDTKAVLSEITGLPPLAEQSRIVTRVEELMRLCDALEAKGQLEAAQHAQLLSTLLGTLTESETPEHLAENWQRIATHFDLLLDRPEAVDALEQTILQLAVRGLLVPQDPQDEPASELLTKIRTEKDKLITAGKIKRDKPLPPIAEDEQPFALPQGWKWVRMQEIFDVRDGTHDTPKYVEQDGVPLITSRNFEAGKICFEGAKLISQVDHEKIMRRSRVERHDILYSMIGGNIGNQVLVDTDREFSIKNVALFKYISRAYTLPLYLNLFLETVTFSLQDRAVGGAQPFVSLSLLRNISFPLPPCAEQSRIVTRVAQLRRLCADLRQRLVTSQATQAKLAEALVAA